jgi:hypothetical protein
MPTYVRLPIIELPRCWKRAIRILLIQILQNLTRCSAKQHRPIHVFQQTRGNTMSPTTCFQHFCMAMCMDTMCIENTSVVLACSMQNLCVHLECIAHLYTVLLLVPSLYIHLCLLGVCMRALALFLTQTQLVMHTKIQLYCTYLSTNVSTKFHFPFEGGKVHLLASEWLDIISLNLCTVQ